MSIFIEMRQAAEAFVANKDRVEGFFPAMLKYRRASKAAIVLELLDERDALISYNKALAACLESMAVSLESEVVQRYAGMQARPALKRKYDADMSEVLEARALIAKVVRP